MQLYNIKYVDRDLFKFKPRKNTNFSVHKILFLEEFRKYFEHLYSKVFFYKTENV